MRVDKPSKTPVIIGIFIFLWLPTFRSTSYTGGRKDGIDFGNIFNCEDFCEDEFNDYLFKCNSLCIVKPHPMANHLSYVNKSNIIYISEKWLLDSKLTLYEVLGSADCLISDISSVIVDFMLLNRPIILLFQDFEEYSQTRGFSFSPIKDYLPAKITQSFKEFMSFIGNGFKLKKDDES